MVSANVVFGEVVLTTRLERSSEAASNEAFLHDTVLSEGVSMVGGSRYPGRNGFCAPMRVDASDEWRDVNAGRCGVFQARGQVTAPGVYDSAQTGSGNDRQVAGLLRQVEDADIEVGTRSRNPRVTKLCSSSGAVGPSAMPPSGPVRKFVHA